MNTTAKIMLDLVSSLERSGWRVAIDASSGPNAEVQEHGLLVAGELVCTVTVKAAP